MSRAAEENVKKLCDLGFSKTKAQKALKDTGGNVTKAKEMLERQAMQQEKEAQQQLLIKQKQQEDEEKKRQQAERRQQHGDGIGTAASPSASASNPSMSSWSSGAAAAGAATTSAGKTAAERLHPCMVQFRSCRYGKFCLLKDLPGDVCIPHFNSACIYGTSCRNRHHINGVDIRQFVGAGPSYLIPEDDGVVARLSDGGVVVRSEALGGGVQLAELVRTSQPTSQLPPVLPPEYCWNAVRGSEASYSDPIGSTSLQTWGDASMTPSGSASAPAGPTPFLDKLLQPAPSKGSEPVPVQHVTSMEPLPASALRPVKYGEPGFIAHPCTIQCGGCKYGDQCLHATRPADVCVFFLNGRCNFDASQCRYRHDDTFTMLPAANANVIQQGNRVPIVTAPAPPPPPKASPSMSTPPLTRSAGASLSSPSVGFVLQPNAVVGGMSVWSLNESLASREQALLERQYAPPSSRGGVSSSFTVSASGSDLLNSSNPNAATPSLHSAFAQRGTPPSISGNGSPLLTQQHANSQQQQATASPTMTAEEERRAFISLLEVFPQVEPGLLLHALRLAAGDRHRVAAALTETHAADPVEQLEAFLNQAWADDESMLMCAEASCSSSAPFGGGHVINHSNLCSSDALLTLCSTFPNLDVPYIEEALHRANGDASEAFAALVCMVERLAVPTFQASKWSSLSSAPAADALKMQRLLAMFPDLPEDVIASCFDASAGSTQKCIEVLTELTGDMTKETLAARTEMGQAAMRGTAGPSPTAIAAAAAPHPGRDDALVSSGGFSVVGSSPRPSQTELYHAVAQEAQEHGDWRRTREQAYMVNRFRIRLLEMAAACYARGDGRAAKQLSRQAGTLGAEYQRLNMIAMRALEEERASQGTSVLDLHGFHVDEAIDVLLRRVHLCRSSGVAKLSIVIGRGLHSVRGRSTVFPAVLQELSSNQDLAACCRVVSVKQASIDVRVRVDR